MWPWAIVPQLLIWWVPQSSSWQACPWFLENIRKEGIMIHIWQVGKLRLRGLSNLSKLSTVLGLKSWSIWLLNLHVPKRLEALEPKGNTPGILMKFRPKGKIFLLPFPLLCLLSLKLVCFLLCTWFHLDYWGKRKRRWMWQRGLLGRNLSWWQLWVLVLIVATFFRADDRNCFSSSKLTSLGLIQEMQQMNSSGVHEVCHWVSVQFPNCGQSRSFASGQHLETFGLVAAQEGVCDWHLVDTSRGAAQHSIMHGISRTTN